LITVRIKYVVEDLDRHGNIRIYFRKRGCPKTRLPGPIGSEPFWIAYRGATAGKFQNKPASRSKPHESSFRWLCECYYGSAEFKLLSPRTRYVRRRVLDLFCDGNGAKPYANIAPKHIRRFRDVKADHPEAANQLLKILRQVLGFAVASDLIDHNAAREVPYIRGNRSGFHTWTIDEVRQYETVHPIGTPARLALALLLYTGQRRSDVVRLGKQHVKDGALTFTQSKGGNRNPVTLTIPILSQLQEVIDASKTGQLVFLASQFAKPFTSDGFGNRFRKWCDAAGLRHCSAHGLRKAGATIAAENGATEHELMAIFGWKTLKQVQIYTRAASQKHLAAKAMHKLVSERLTNESVPLSRPVVQSGTKSIAK
jgi:integrase